MVVERSRPARRDRDARRGRGARAEERDDGDRDREGDERDGRELMRRALLALVVVALLAPRGRRARATQLTVYAAASLTDVFPKIDSSRALLLRRLEPARGADPAGRARRRLRLREHDAAEPALREGAVLEAGRVHAQHARRSSCRSANPAGIRSVYDLTKRGREARRRRTGRAGRQLHAAGAEEHEPRGRGAEERRQPGDGRARGARRRSRSARPTRASSTRPTRRTVPGQVTDDQGAGVGAAEGAVRHLRRHARARTRPTRRRSSSACWARAAQKKLLAAGLPAARQEEGSASESARRRVRRGGARRARVPAAADRRDLRAHLARATSSSSSRTRSSATRSSSALKTSLIAQVLIVAVRDAGWRSCSRAGRFRGHALAVTLVELPLVLPPAVAGIGLLAAFGRLGLLGSSLSALGISLPFTQTAVTLAVAYVASPLYIRQAIAAFEATDPNLAAASRTLGAGPARTFFRVSCRSRAAASIAGPRALVRARPRRVRRDDHVRRQPAEGHADAAARDLRRVRRSTSTRRSR